jgi:hypothetical protein
VHIQPISSLALAVSWFTRSPPPAWIASRSRKLSACSFEEGYCASAPSGCGCVRRRQSVQSVLPGALATALEQPSSWHRLPPPCAMQWSVEDFRTSWGIERLPPGWYRSEARRRWGSSSDGDVYDDDDRDLLGADGVIDWL